VTVSTGVVAGLIWIGFAAHRPRTAAVIVTLVERKPLGVLHRSMTRYPDVTPGEEFTGYS
jgi:hypothetical protein